MTLRRYSPLRKEKENADYSSRSASFYLTQTPHIHPLGYVFIHLDCEQSLYSSKIRGDERKTSKRANVIVSVMWPCRKTLEARASKHDRKDCNTPVSQISSESDGSVGLLVEHRGNNALIAIVI